MADLRRLFSLLPVCQGLARCVQDRERWSFGLCAAIAGSLAESAILVARTGVWYYQHHQLAVGCEWSCCIGFPSILPDDTGTIRSKGTVDYPLSSSIMTQRASCSTLTILRDWSTNLRVLWKLSFVASALRLTNTRLPSLQACWICFTLTSKSFLYLESYLAILLGTGDINDFCLRLKFVLTCEVDRSVWSTVTAACDESVQVA